MKEDTVKRLMKLFEGFSGASGTHGTPERDPESLKWNIKSTAKTLRVPVSEKLWEEHVTGKKPLGVIPIREDNTCSWGSIDIDEYDADVLSMVKLVEQSKYPLVPCRSKSGGLHLFLFLEKPEPAAEVQAVLRDAAASLGMAESEIFPKQTKILIERNDLGSWMIMPYFGSTYDGKLKNQHGVKKTGAEMTMGEFVSLAEKTLTTTVRFAKLCKARRGPTRPKKRGNGAASSGDFSDGPPCLQHLTSSIGVQKDGRKRTLFMMALYYKRATPDEWKANLEKANHRFFKDPLPATEVEGIYKSVNKKDYQYTCKEEPMRSCCDSVLCRSRRFGVGVGGEYPEITSMSKLDSHPPVWFVDVLGERLVLTTEDLQIYHRFHRHCMDKVNKAYRMMKQNDWMRLVSEAMDKLILIESPEEAKEGRQFFELLEEFLTDRARGEREEDLRENRPWENVEHGRHYFRAEALFKFLDRQKFRNDRGQIFTMIKRVNGGKKFLNLKNEHGVRVWFVPNSIFESVPPVVPPKVQEDSVS